MNITNNFAVTSADIGEALMRSASALKSNGMDVNEGIGLIVGAQETVQNAGEYLPVISKYKYL